MPYEATRDAVRRVAVIGAGISGMGAAYHLSRNAHVTLYEADKRLGGHARTIVAGRNRDQPVDTGFIVFNRVNYPHLCALFDSLDVPVAESNMSFAASIDGGRLEYALQSLNSLFAQRRNALNPRFLGMINDILRFNRLAETLATDEDMTIRDLLARLGSGEWFRDYYILPFSGAIWSTPTDGILDFPAAAMVRFFRNHGLLGVQGQHQWYTVRGGSREYVGRLRAAMESRGVDIRTSAAVDQVRRLPGSAHVKTHGAEWEHFDAVILATHSDDALRLLADPTPEESRALAAIRYQPNEAVLHSDTRLMPRRRVCWASWNYVEPAAGRGERIDLTYWMNSLQPIPHSDPLFVTLNAARVIDPATIHDIATFHHPVYDVAALAAQRTMRAINGANATWYCGAWMKNGFHEDGLASAIDVVEALTAQAERAAA
jgi:predicted NAD/FAD-binding protein